MKTCGGCTACCQIIPVKELGTKPFQGCPHVLTAIHAGGPGCGIYADRPPSCRRWRCGWLENDWADDLRPDRCGFVVDEVLDLVVVNGVERPAAQLWVLPGHEDDHQRQPAIAMILALLHDTGVNVLWRMAGDRAFGFHLNPETGKPEMTHTTRNDALLGPEAERMLKAEMMYRQANPSTGER